MDELEKYYQYLKSKGAKVPDTYDSFRNTLQDENSAKAYYDYLRKNKFNAPDTYDSFANTLGLKKKVGGEESADGGNIFLQTTDATKPTTSVDFNALNALQGGSKVATPQQKEMAEYGKNVQESPEKLIEEAAVNSTIRFYENNPSLLAGRNFNITKSKPYVGGKFDINQLKNASPFQQNVAELKNKVKSGEYITTLDNNGKPIVARPKAKVDTFVKGVSDAWNANKQVNAYDKMTVDEKINHALENKPDEYLPEKADTKSLSYEIGSAIPATGKMLAAGATGAVMSAAVPETGGLSTAGLPAVLMWASITPDMAKQGQMNAEIDAIKKLKNEHPDWTNAQIYDKAKDAGVIGYAEGLATGTAMNFIGSGLPVNAGQGTWKALGQYLKNQPQSVAEIAGLSAGSSIAADEAKKALGLNITNAEEWDKAGQSMSSGAKMQLIFNAAHGLFQLPKYVKAQAYQDLSHVIPEELQALQQKAVEAGIISQEQADKTTNSLNEFKEAQKKVIPTGNQEKDAVITGLVQKKANLEKLKSETDKSYHDEIDAQIENADQRIQLAKQTNDPIKYAEQDDLDGTKNFNPKPFDELSKKEVEGIATEIPKEYGDAEVEEVGGGEGSERKYKANPTVNRQQGFIKIKDKISTEDKVYNDKADAEAASQKALAQHYYEHGMDETLKPENKKEPEGVSTVSSVENETLAVGKVLGMPVEEVNVLSMLHDSKVLTTEEKKMLYRQYKRGVMNENDVSKFTHIKVEDLQQGNIDKWAQVILDKTKGKKITAEDIDFEEIPNTQSNETKAQTKEPIQQGSERLKKAIKDADEIYGKKESKGALQDKEDAKALIKKRTTEKFEIATKERLAKDLGLPVTYFDDVSFKEWSEINPANSKKDYQDAFNDLKEKYKSDIEAYETTKKAEIPIQQTNEGSNTSNEPISASQSSEAESGVPEITQTENIGGQNAIPIESPNAVDVRQSSGNGEKVGIGNKQSEELTAAQDRATQESSNGEIPPINGEGKVGVYVQYPKTQLSHAGEDKLVTEFGGDNYFTKPEVKSRQKLFKEADELMEKGITAPKLMYELANGDKKFLSDAEHVVLVRYADALANKLRNTDPSSAEWDRLLAERNKVINASSPSGTEAARALGARNISIEGQDPNSYENFMDTEYVANDNAPLTPNQKAKAIKEFTKLKETTEEESKAVLEIENNLAKDKAEKEFNEEVKKAKGTKKSKKTHEDFVKERKDAINKAREALKKIRTGESGVTAVPIPVLRELVAIAPHVKKALTSLAEEGYIKLADAVKQLHEDFKDVLEGLTERNIHDIIAGEYNEKQPSKSDIAKNIEDLRIEAQLVNKLEKALKGEWPKNEKQRQKRTKEIDDLRQQLVDLKKEEFEASKFYGESDATQRRIWAKEDELQRLKERKPKVKEERERKEISEREKQLNEEIKKEREAYNKELPDYESKLKNVISRNLKETARLKEKLAKGEYSKDEKNVPLLENETVKKKYPELRKEAIKAKDERIKVSHEVALRRAKQMYQNRTPQEKTLEVFSKSLNIPRTLMTIGDFSAVMRQAAVATTAHPVIASKALKFMFESAANEKIYNRWLEDVHKDPLWETAEKSKLPITDPESLHTKEHEEAYYGSQYAEQIPGLGHVVKASERAYNGYLNFIRWEMFKMYAEQFKDAGKTFDNNPKLYKGLASFIGSATGRGGMRAGESAAPILNWFLFASRLIASRVNMLGLTDIPNLAVQGAKYAVKGATLGKVNPNWGLDFGFYTRLPKEIRVTAMKDMLKFVGTGIATLYLAKAAGMDVETDPRSSDFGKAKDGNTRWDIWGGFQPYARLLTQIVTGQAKSATTGKVYDLDATKFGGRGIGEQIGTFARGKLAPTWGIAADILTRRTLDQKTLERRFDIPFYKADNPKEGNITLTDELIKSITPLLFNDVVAAMQDKGLSALFTVGLPSLFGIGVQTYAPRTPRQSSNSSNHGNPHSSSHKVEHGHSRN